ncbi:TPA: hypothetical protein ACXEMW_003758 [Proteus mirabilis]
MSTEGGSYLPLLLAFQIRIVVLGARFPIFPLSTIHFIRRPGLTWAKTK